MSGSERFHYFALADLCAYHFITHGLIAAERLDLFV